MAKLDNKTQKVQDTGRAVHDLVRGEAWGIVKKKLTDKIVDLQWIGNVQGQTMEERDLDMQAKQLAVDLLYSWLEEIEGISSQHENNQQLVQSVKMDIYKRELE